MHKRLNNEGNIPPHATEIAQPKLARLMPPAARMVLQMLNPSEYGSSNLVAAPTEQSAAPEA